MDLADRKIIGWALSETMKAADTTIASWQMAIKNRPLIQTVLFHSDRGIQYACHEFREKLKLYPVIQSMSRKGNCWDNAVAESFFKTIKTELIYQTRWETREKARQAIFEYIEVWYNRKRKHSTLGYLTPVQMEDLFNQEKVAAEKVAKKLLQFQIYQVHDPCTPLKVQHGIFTRWNKGKQGLDFYNGVLRRILPGKDPGELDIFRFSVDEPIEIVQPIGEGLVRKEVDYEAR